MRHLHLDNPFHLIQRWTGTYFRKAELWEVGAYVLIRHHEGEPLCDLLRTQQQYLEQAEHPKDDAEQHTLLAEVPEGRANMSSDPITEEDPDWAMGDDTGTQDARSADAGAEAIADQAFWAKLDDFHAGNQHDNPFEEPWDDDTGSVCEAETEVTNVPPYLPTAGAFIETAGLTEQADSPGPLPRTDAFQNAYVRIVHTNGIHYLALVACQCHGNSQLPLDLIACRLWPTSFHTIRTLFTDQLLRYFRLCNLELKASSYQFYQLLRRLSNPIAPADVPNLYREFRRLGRLWRWMKKLRGAGFGHNGKDPMNVDPGELANYCPACPQPGKNLRDDWKTDNNRYVICYMESCRFSPVSRYVFKRAFVADGNFKADHVEQKNGTDDIWLSEGGGMDPKRDEYNDFLLKATEKLTVCDFKQLPYSVAYHIGTGQTESAM